MIHVHGSEEKKGGGGYTSRLSELFKVDMVGFLYVDMAAAMAPGYWQW